MTVDVSDAVHFLFFFSFTKGAAHDFRDGSQAETIPLHRTGHRKSKRQSGTRDGMAQRVREPSP